MNAHDATSPGSTLLSPRGWLVWGAAIVTWGLLLFSYRHLTVLAEGDWEPFQPTLIDEMIGGLAFGLLYFPLRALVRRFPLQRLNWRRRAPLYVAAVLLVAPAATSFMWASRSLLYPLAGLGRYDYGIMPLRYFMEFPMQLIGFSVMVFVLHAVDHYRDAQERRVRAADIERALAQAQVRSLRLQLQPHFLFNALNTISSTLYRDPAAADEMIEQLSQLLRTSLRTTQTDEVPLGTELEALEQYLALMRARFGERLCVNVAVEQGLEQTLVPSMVLQPLVENAVRHGGVTVNGRGTVDVRARRDREHLVLEVQDDGPGSSERVTPQPGIGLSATAERLALLYGEQQRFEAGNAPAGGFLVKIVLPLRTPGSDVLGSANPESRVPLRSSEAGGGSPEI
jgi:signal transduction histidine kinase